MKRKRRNLKKGKKLKKRKKGKKGKNDKEALRRAIIENIKNPASLVVIYNLLNWGLRGIFRRLNIPSREEYKNGKKYKKYQKKFIPYGTYKKRRLELLKKDQKNWIFFIEEGNITKNVIGVKDKLRDFFLNDVFLVYPKELPKDIPTEELPTLDYQYFHKCGVELPTFDVQYFHKYGYNTNRNKVYKKKIISQLSKLTIAKLSDLYIEFKCLHDVEYYPLEKYELVNWLFEALFGLESNTKKRHLEIDHLNNHNNGTIPLFVELHKGKYTLSGDVFSIILSFMKYNRELLDNFGCVNESCYLLCLKNWRMLKVKYDTIEKIPLLVLRSIKSVVFRSVKRNWNNSKKMMIYNNMFNLNTLILKGTGVRNIMNLILKNYRIRSNIKKIVVPMDLKSNNSIEFRDFCDLIPKFENLRDLRCRFLLEFYIQNTYISPKKRIDFNFPKVFKQCTKLKSITIYGFVLSYTQDSYSQDTDINRKYTTLYHFNTGLEELNIRTTLISPLDWVYRLVNLRKLLIGFYFKEFDFSKMLKLESLTVFSRYSKGVNNIIEQDYCLKGIYELINLKELNYYVTGKIEVANDKYIKELGYFTDLSTTSIGIAIPFGIKSFNFNTFKTNILEIKLLPITTIKRFFLFDYNKHFETYHLDLFCLSKKLQNYKFIILKNENYSTLVKKNEFYF